MCKPRKIWNVYCVCVLAYASIAACDIYDVHAQRTSEIHAFNSTLLIFQWRRQSNGMALSSCAKPTAVVVFVVGLSCVTIDNAKNEARFLFEAGRMSIDLCQIKCGHIYLFILYSAFDIYKCSKTDAIPTSNIARTLFVTKTFLSTDYKPKLNHLK